MLKTSSALRVKQQQGDFIGAWAAYGYLRDLQNKHRLVTDALTAEVVRQIFAWKAQGMGNQAITCKLTQQEIPSPSAYRYRLGLVQKPELAAVPWRVNKIKAILQNEVYLGHTVQRCKRASLYLLQKQRNVARAVACGAGYILPLWHSRCLKRHRRSCGRGWRTIGSDRTRRLPSRKTHCAGCCSAAAAAS